MAKQEHKGNFKKAISSEVSLAWAKIQSKDKSKAQVKEKPEEKKAQEKEESLEETIVPEEKTEFVSKLPERAPSLRFEAARQNLESSIGPSTEKEEDEKGLYSSSKNYTKTEEKEKEKKYETVKDFTEQIVTRAPTVFERADISENIFKGKPVQMKEFFPGKQEEMLEYTTKDFNNAEIEFGFERKDKKYKAFRQ